MTKKPTLGNDKGSVLAFVAVLLAILLAFGALAIDIGAAGVVKRQMVTAADAGALAGALELPSKPSKALDKALEYAVQKNGADADKTMVVVGDDQKTLTVKASRTYGYKLAGALGFQAVDVGAWATAIIQPVSGMRGIVPLAVPWQESFVYGQEYELKVGQWKEGELGPGNTNPVAPGKPGANDFRTHLKDGYPGMVRVGDQIDTESGNMSGPTRDAVQYRIDKCRNNCDASHTNCPLVVYIPLYDPPADPKKVKDITVASFAAFRLKDETGNGNNSKVKGYFIEFVTPEAEIDGSPSGHGLYGVRLIR